MIRNFDPVVMNMLVYALKSGDLESDIFLLKKCQEIGNTFECQRGHKYLCKYNSNYSLDQISKKGRNFHSNSIFNEESQSIPDNKTKNREQKLVHN